MKFLIRSLIAAGVFAVLTGPTNAETKPSLTANGLGPFAIGMSLDEANQHLHRKIIPHEVSTRATPNCDYNDVPELPGIAFVFINNKLMRIDVQKPAWKYEGTISIGMDKRDFLVFVQHAKQEPLDHIPAGVSYVVNGTNARNAVSFQFEGDKLSRMIAGDRKVIRYAEACM